MYEENETHVKRNEAVLNDLARDIYTIGLMKKFQIIANTHWQQLKLLKFKNKQIQEV